jgi:hypothetical protein
MARLRATAPAARSVLDGREHDGILDQVGAVICLSNNQTIKRRSQNAIKKRADVYPPDPHSLCRGVVAKGHQMGVHFTNHSPQLGVLVVVGFIVNADQDVFDGLRHDGALPKGPN